ncbi:DinB family protein [Robiginitalea sp. SC105]|uniref:DinB family protein n=1 Tax=Robiginitalea sp. SC105 TaxID=2762332 RepID=UPI00163A522A|nr:DinB family protein [Robiginitalea sp. SC105]MBC2838395.1 damage-inducible protein DinB [Robiginitalea sp. SC105]
MKTYFQQLFDYNYYCNKRLIEACSEMEEVPARTAELFSHILNAHHIWNARILENDPQFEVWQRQEIDQWPDLHYENQRNSFEVITNADHLEKRVGYLTSDGRSFTNTLQDILFHIINHSTHHRAQIASDFRANGKDPLALDYIFYKR